MKTMAFVAWLDDVQLLTYVGHYFVLMNFGFDFYYDFGYYCSRFDHYYSHPVACVAAGLGHGRAVVCHDFVSSVALRALVCQKA